MFGLTGAAFAVSVDGKTEIETAKDPTVTRPNELAKFKGMSSYMDIQKGRLYCAREFDSVIGSHLQFFDYKVGDILPTGEFATTVDTNMWMSMALPAPQCFAVERVGVVFSPMCDPDDRSRFIDTSIVEVWIGQKQYFRRPLAEMFSVGEMNMGKNPEAPVKGLVDLDPLPLILMTQQMFYGQIVTKPYDYKKRMRVWLVYDGLDVRGVQ